MGQMQVQKLSSQDSGIWLAFIIYYMWFSGGHRTRLASSAYSFTRCRDLASAAVFVLPGRCAIWKTYCAALCFNLDRREFGIWPRPYHPGLWWMVCNQVHNKEVISSLSELFGVPRRQPVFHLPSGCIVFLSRRLEIWRRIEWLLTIAKVGREEGSCACSASVKRNLQHDQHVCKPAFFMEINIPMPWCMMCGCFDALHVTCSDDSNGLWS